MKEKMSIKKVLTIVIVILILILAIIGGWYYLYKLDADKMSNDDSRNSINTNSYLSNSISNNGTHNINKLTNDKEVVYSSYSNITKDYSYSIPFINIDSNDSNKINQQIQSYYKNLIDAELKDYSTGGEVSTKSVKYDFYTNSNILSLVISQSSLNDYIDYKVYNIDIYSGDEITNSKLLSLMNISEKDYLAKLKGLYNDEFIKAYGTKESYEKELKSSTSTNSDSNVEAQLKLYDELLEKTISNDNYGINTPIFLDSNGKLTVVANIYSLAGAGSYKHFISIAI